MKKLLILVLLSILYTRSFSQDYEIRSLNEKVEIMQISLNVYYKKEQKAMHIQQLGGLLIIGAYLTHNQKNKYVSVPIITIGSGIFFIGYRKRIKNLKYLHHC